MRKRVRQIDTDVSSAISILKKLESQFWNNPNDSVNAIECVTDLAKIGLSKKPNYPNQVQSSYAYANPWYNLYFNN